MMVITTNNDRHQSCVYLFNMIVLIAGIFIAIMFFYYLDQKRKMRNERKRERTREKFDQMLQQLERRDRVHDK